MKARIGQRPFDDPARGENPAQRQIALQERRDVGDLEVLNVQHQVRVAGGRHRAVGVHESALVAAQLHIVEFHSRRMPVDHGRVRQPPDGRIHAQREIVHADFALGPHDERSLRRVIALVALPHRDLNLTRRCVIAEPSLHRVERKPLHADL